MADKTLLCTCIVCLKANQNKIKIKRNKYNRHRKKQKELLEKDEILEVIEQEENLKDVESQMEDILYQEEFQIENINKSDQDDSFNEDDEINKSDEVNEDDEINEDNENNVNNENNENFNLSEEDNEYYSDYDIYDIEREDDNDNENIKNNDDNKDNDEHEDNNENNNDEESDDKENNDEIDEDNDIMQIDNITNILSKEIIEGLQLLHLKTLYNFTESAYDDIMKIFTTNNISLYKVKKYLKEITGLASVFYDMCENSCICYTGQYEFYQNCPKCDSIRLDTNGKAKRVMPYLSIIDRLKIQFNNENRAEELLYRHEYITNKDNNDLDDIFDGEIYKELVNNSLFNDKRDIAFIASCDGYQIFKQKTDDCWPFLMINNNLDPSLRVKKENLLILFLIPRPNQPKDINTFLWPFINEMKE